MAMMNDRLRDALMAARMTNEDLAANLGVAAKRADGGRTQARRPSPQFRHRISVLVQKDERWLWPDGYSHRRRGEITESEIVKVYPYRADVPDELWARLFENAVDQIGILVYSGFFLAEQHVRQIGLLKKKADDGASIRILPADPDSAAWRCAVARKTSVTRSRRRSATSSWPITGRTPAIPASGSRGTPLRCT